MKAVCIAYLLGLTYLLVVKEPLGFIERHPGLGTLSHNLVPVAHFLSFALLGILIAAARWPNPRWAVWGLAVTYALGTEAVQAFLPWRTAEACDFVQNLAGIAVGGTIWWLGSLLCRRARPTRSAERTGS